MTEKEQEHGKEFNIIVNGRERPWKENKISFDQVVNLAFGTSTNDSILYTVTYKRGRDEHKPEGIMVKGDTVKVKEGTVFNVTATNKS